jgi:glycosyltransferase involved in cell wall biosynthesis
MIITPTESVKKDLCDCLQVAPEKVIAIPEAPRSNFYPASLAEIVKVKRTYGLRDGFVLFVGTIEPRKNLFALIKAFEEVRKCSSLRPQLVIVGKKGWLSDDLFSYIERSGIKEQIILTDYVSDDDLRALYSACGVFVYPSLYEGFGLPPLEAMACGAPVITSRIPSLIETTGGAAILVSPKDVSSLAEEIVRVLQSEEKRRYFSQKGLEHASQFSWRKTALLTLEVYKHLLGI